MLYSVLKADGKPRRNMVGLATMTTRLDKAKRLAWPGDRILQITKSGHIRRVIEVA